MTVILFIDLVLLLVIFVITKSYRLLDFRFLFLFIYFVYYRLGFEFALNSPDYRLMRAREAFWDAYYLDLYFFHIILIYVLLIVCVRPSLTFPRTLKDKFKYKFDAWYYLTVAVCLLSMVELLVSLLQVGFNLSELRKILATGSLLQKFSSTYIIGFAPLLVFYYVITSNIHRAYVLMILMVIGFILSGQKFLILLSFHLLLLVRMIINGKYNYLVAIGSSILALPILIYLVMLSNPTLLMLSADTVQTALQGLLRRLIFVGPSTVVNYFETFPSGHQFLMNSNSEVPSDVIVYNYRFNTGLAGTVNSFSYSKMYAYYGSSAIALSLALLIFIPLLSFNFIGRYFIGSRDIISAALLTLMFHTPRLIVTDVQTVLLAPLLGLCTLYVTNELFAKERVVLRSQTKTISMRGSLFGVVTVLILAAYFVQGQIKILVLSMIG